MFGVLRITSQVRMIPVASSEPRDYRLLLHQPNTGHPAAPKGGLTEEPPDYRYSVYRYSSGRVQQVYGIIAGTRPLYEYSYQRNTYPSV